jgi:ABC-type amino acid transport system permease subunit
MSKIIDDGGIAVQSEIIKQLNALLVDVTSIRTKFIAHTHNAGIAVISAGEQPAALTATSVTKGL